MKRARIAGLGRGIAERVITNLELESRVDTSDAWITERTGIRERRIAAAGQNTSDLAAAAALSACHAAGVRPAELDAILLATVTPDMPMPATAAFVQQKIGAGICPAFDLSAACAGFLYGLAAADAFIARGRFKRVLVVGVELLSRVLDWTDRNTCVLFGDAAGAAVLVPEEGERGLLDVELHTDGAHARDLFIPGGGSVSPTSAETVAAGLHVVHMDGRRIFVQAVRRMSEACSTVLARNGLGPDEVSLVVPHQANLRILESVSERTGIPMERFVTNIQRHGNTSSASVPVALSEALEEGRIVEGDLLLLTALGAGISWGAALIRW